MNPAIMSSTLTTIILMERARRNRIRKHIVSKKEKGEMGELLNTFIGKTVSITTIDGNYALQKFIIREINGNAILLETKSQKKIIINADFVIGIEEVQPWK